MSTEEMGGRKYHISEISNDKRASPSKFINQQNTQPFSQKSNNIIDSLVLQGVCSRDTNLTIDLHRVILDGGDTGHLDRSLQRTSDEQTSERGSISEEFDIGFGLVLVLIGNALLDLVEFCPDPRVLLIAVCMETSQICESFLGSVMIDQPTRINASAIVVKRIERQTYRGLSGNRNIRAASPTAGSIWSPSGNLH